ncbi:MAG TPA: hypothetical protein VJC10_04170 [Patescibacteria group bacterium]|nr:hypothetical protein [Patescibacteria group bacterium]
MKKFLLFIFSLITVSFLTILPAYAEEGAGVDPCPKGSQFDQLCDLTSGDLSEIINLIVIVLLIAAVLISLFFLIFGGIKWILSGGDKGGVEAARNMIVAAIVGLIIAFLSYFILQIVLGFFGINLRDIKLPKLPI